MSNALWNLHAIAVPDAECSDFDTVTEWAANEIESLRQRVKELEEARDKYMEIADYKTAELAALKQTQAEPVAWLTDRETMYFDKEDARRDCDGFIEPLYK